MSDLTDEIVALATDVYRTLGAGYMESPYQKAMEVGLRLKGIKFEAQKVVELKYLGHYVGDSNIDLLVADSIVVELKAIAQEIGAPEEQQLLRYMTPLGLKIGILVNFSQVPRRKERVDLPDKPEIIILGGADANS